MAEYADNLTPTQKRNAALLVQAMKDDGITNPLTHAAVLSVVSKESEFNPAASEVGYKNTANARIRQIFSKTKPLTDAQLNALKADNKKFFDFVYNGIAGNGPADGYKYRGRGFNQLTGKANYANIAKLSGIDFLNDPDLLAQPEYAAKAAVAYFKNGAETLKRIGKLSAYNATDLNDFKTLNDSLGAIYHINAGPGQSAAHIKADVTGGLAKTLARGSSLYAMVGGMTADAIEVVKKNPMTSLAIAGLTALGLFLMYKAITTNS